ncbi:signal peptide protein [Caballeronia peredens]|nr:signal peptide protein [Caballeronia peredens]
MKKKLLGLVIGLGGLAALAMSAAANAHVDVAVGVGVPVYSAPVYAQPAVPVGYYGYGDDHERWREREWRRHEWRERHWRHEARREERWREHHGW